ncbi:MAG: 50S ribosomal protein L15 [Gammaproteobacteria bacterium]|nr:MAG: 50S ribosomal protein L15 [Gammaproteobacteria bacterium]
MFLNTIKPAVGSTKKAKRVGRGIGCTDGKTCGRGHKGQKSRSGGFHKVGFEGGQMPLQRRLPKVGFTAAKSSQTSQVRLSELSLLGLATITIEDLIQNNTVHKRTKVVKVFKSGTIDKAITIKGLKVTKGAKEEIEKAGGKVE